MCVLVSASREFKSCLRDDRRERFSFSSLRVRQARGSRRMTRGSVPRRAYHSRSERRIAGNAGHLQPSRVATTRSSKVIGATRAWMTTVVDENLNDERRRENEREHVSGRACVVTKRYVKRTTYLYRTVCGELLVENRKKKRKRERESETIRDESNKAEEE